MSCVDELMRSWSRAAALWLVTFGLAACSSDTSRFDDDWFAARSSPATTGSIAQGASGARVESRPLPPQAAQAAPSHAASAASAVSHGTAGVDTRTASYSAAPVHRNAPEATGAGKYNTSSRANWSWDGGTAITIAEGDTVEGIARRHGVPASAIIQANSISSPATIYPGQRLVIPRYNASPAASAAAAAAQRPAAPKGFAATPVGNAGVHVVTEGETLSRIARRYGKRVGEIARANKIEATAKLSIGERLVIPGVRSSSAKPGVAQAKQQVASVKEPAEPAPSASVFTPVEPPPVKESRSSEATGALPKFRWPASGRVIAGFGAAVNGQPNDGINIAVPENTPIKAAEEGVIAYAGNELKGYGNLVLVRHSNGYVTAYAHAKELLVKRGEAVKRGQVIARSGQTGNVNAPQLHFEIRKGASPLDPMRHL